MPDLGKRSGEVPGQRPAASSAASDADKTPGESLLARLDDLLGAYWLDAMSGDLKSAEFVRRIVQQQAEMYGLRGKVTTPAADEGDDELAKLRARRASA